MIAGVLTLLVIGLALLVAERGDGKKRRVEELHARTAAAAAVVDNEYKQARRAMNDAADQSWRNIID